LAAAGQPEQILEILGRHMLETLQQPVIILLPAQGDWLPASGALRSSSTKVNRRRSLGI
jgi:hypothetical protein